MQIDQDAPRVTKLGDLWELGSHRLLCGDATEAACYQRLLNSDQASLVFTNPPYNAPIKGHVSGLGQAKYREFAMASGELTETEFTSFLETVFRNLARHSSGGSIYFVCMDWRHMREALAGSDTV